MTKPTDSLMEDIRNAIGLVRWGNANEYEEISLSKAEALEIEQTLTDCRTRLSPPVIDGELEEEYKNALEQLDDMPMLGNCSKHYSAVKRIKKALTALHDELARKEGEIERLTIERDDYMKKLAYCGRELYFYKSKEQPYAPKEFRQPPRKLCEDK